MCEVKRLGMSETEGFRKKNSPGVVSGTRGEVGMIGMSGIQRFKEKNSPGNVLGTGDVCAIRLNQIA